jgi:3-hydroxybutyryl-CoA dehydratase
MGSVTTDSDLRGSPVTVTADMIRQYADITNDHNPIHLDPVFAASTPMGGVIAHGTMSLALIWQMLRAAFGPARSSRADLSIRFTRPVRVGARLTASATPMADGSYRVQVADQDGLTVIEGSVRL